MRLDVGQHVLGQRAACASAVHHEAEVHGVETSARPDGVAIGIDHIPDLVEWSRSNVAKDGKQPLVEAGVLELHVRDGFKGYEEKGPYDAIHVGAAPERIPEALKQQLRPGGVLLLPVGPNGGAQEFVRVTRDAKGGFTQQSLFGVRYVPLTTPERQCPSGRR